jgi:hypothetical protein
VLAPTGQAARRLARRINLEVSTVHSAIYTRGGIKDNGEEAPPTSLFVLDQERAAGQVTIIDEASLIGDTANELIDQKPIVQFGAGNLLSDVLEYCLPLGGKLVLVGDPFQLASFGEETALALEEATFVKRGVTVEAVELNEIVRQADGSAIAALGSAIRSECESGMLRLPAIESFIGSGDVQMVEWPVPENLLDELGGEESVVLAWRNADVGRWNQKIRRRLGATDDLPQVGDRLVAVQWSPRSMLMNGDELRIVGVRGIEVVRRRGDEVTLVDCGIEVFDEIKHDLVVQQVFLVIDVLNNSDRLRLRTVTQILWVDFLLRMSREGIDRKRDWEQFWERADNDPRWNAVRATYSYARTVYRAQGGEWQRVVFDARGISMLKGQRLHLGYTAVTRAKKVLHVRNWPAVDSGHSIDADWMCRELDGLCRGVVGRPLSLRPLNSTAPAVQVRDPGGTEFVADVYSKKGRLSTVVVQTSGGAGWSEDLVNEIKSWIFSQNVESSPPPDEVADSMTVVSELLTSDGIDLRVWTKSAFIMGVELITGDRRHVGHYHHDAAGRITKSIAGDPEGVVDIELRERFEFLTGYVRGLVSTNDA